jgi:hypothetical protein
VPTFDQIRQLFPSTQGLSDEQIVQRTAELTQMPYEDVANSFGVAPKTLKSDTINDLKVGVQKLPGMVSGIADIPAALVSGSRPFDYLADKAGELTGFQPSKWAVESEKNYSPERVRAQAAIDQAWKDPDSTVSDKARAYLDNPRATLGSIVQSGPSMVAGGVIGRGLGAVAGISRVAGGAAGEGVAMAGSQMDEIDRKADARGAAAASLLTGATGAAVGLAGGRIAQRLGVSDVDTALAGGARTAGRSADLPIYGRVPAGMLSEGAEEFAQSVPEQMFKNWAEDKPLTEGALRAGVEGTLAGSAMGGAFGLKRNSNSILPSANPGTNTGEEPAQTFTHETPPLGQGGQGDIQFPVNPYNVGGYVDQLGQGNVYTPDSRQGEMFSAGAAPAQTLDPAAVAMGQAAAAEQKPGKQDQEIPHEAIQYVVGKYGTGKAWVNPVTNTEDGLVWQGEQYHTAEDLKKAQERFAKNEAKKSAGMRAVEDAVVEHYRGTEPDTEITPKLLKPFTPKEVATATDLKGAVGRLITPVRKLQESLMKEEAKNADEANKGDPDKIAEYQKQLATYQAVFKKAEVAFPEAPKPEVKAAKKSAAPATTTAAPQAVATAGQPTVTLKRGKNEVVRTKEQLALELAKASPENRARILDLLGLDAEGHAVNAPMSMEDAALASQARTGKKVTKQAIQLSLKQYGIDAEVIGKMAAVQTPTVALEELMPEGSEQGAATGFSLVDSPNQTDVIEQHSKREKELIDAASGVIKENEAVQVPEVVTPEEQARADAIETKRRSEAEAERRMAAIKAVQSPYARVAGQDWDDMRSSGSPDFDALSTEDKVEWITVYEAYKLGKIEDEDLVDHQRDMERFLDGVSNEGNNTGAVAALPDSSGSQPAGTADDGPEIPAQRAESGVDDGEGAVPQTAAEAQARIASVKVGTKKKRTIQKPTGTDGPQFSKGEAATSSTVEDVTREVEEFIGAKTGRKVIVVQDLESLPADIQQSVGASKDTQGFVIGGKAYLIADNIAPGTARAVFMHEVGSHLGLENILTDDQFDNLVDKLVAWAEKDDGSVESELARKALVRVISADPSDHQRNAEFVAYFIEEAVNAGLDPTATKYQTPLDRWFSTVWDAFKSALRRLNILGSDKFTAQDLVDIAYGAARLEMDSDPAADTGEAQFSKRMDRVPEPARQTWGTLANAAKKGMYAVAFTHDLLDIAKKTMPSAQTYRTLMDKKSETRLKHEQRVEKVLDTAAKLSDQEKTTVNKFLKDATVSGKWAYVPDFKPAAVVDPDMERRFKALSPAAQSTVKSIFSYGHDVLEKKRALLNGEINAEAEARIKEAKGDRKLLEQIEKERAADLRRFGNKLKGLDGPYAPLKRFGSYVVSARSQAYLDADDKAKRAMEDQEEHNLVLFADTAGEAQAIARKLEADPRYAYVSPFEKEVRRDVLYGDSSEQFSAFSRIRTQIENQFGQDSKTANHLHRLASDLYLTTLADAAARNSEKHRKNIAGADGDMLRAFATQGRADAGFLSALEHNADVTMALINMRNETQKAKSDVRMEASQVYNELLERHASAMENTPTPTVDKLMALNSIWMLATSPAYHLTNLMQTVMVTVPVLNGRFGMFKTWRATRSGYTDVARALKANGAIDLDKLPADVRGALEELNNRGRLDMSITEDMGRWARTGSSPSVMHTVVDKMRLLSRKTEAVNRVSAAIAAYRLARKEGSHEAALEFADRTIRQTHGDYSGFNTPRVMRSGAARVVTQFRKYQLMQMSLLARLMKDSFAGASTEERWVARKALAYTFLHTGVMAGAMGMPMMSLIGWGMAKAFGDEDEPENFELMLRRAIDDDAVADLLLHGVGMDKVGLGQVADPLPFADYDFTSRKGFEKMVFSALGPTFGLGARAAAGIGDMAQGEWYKGLEQLMPSGVANAMKATRIAEEGFTNKRGDVTLSADEISLTDTILQGIGYTPSTLRERQFNQNALGDFEAKFKDRVDSLTKQYAKAVKEGEDTSDIRDAWGKLQDTQRRNGFTPSPLATLLKAPMEQNKRERGSANGVEYTKRNAGFVRSLPPVD